MGLKDKMASLFLFYLKLWDLIKKDFIALVRAFERNELDIARVNYVMLTFEEIQTCSSI